MALILTALTKLDHSDWDMHGDLGSGWGIVMVVLMITFWAAVIVGAIWLVRTTAGHGVGYRETPLETLRRRLAEGQITPEEYDRLHEKLSAPR